MPEARTETSSGAKEAPRRDQGSFSLASGGLLFRFWRRARLSGDSLELARRRVIAVLLVMWLPLLLLSAAEGNAWGRSGIVTFLKDVETNARLLIAAPLLILAEIRIQRILSEIVRLFVERGLIPDRGRSQFDAAIASAMRLRDSVAPELLFIAFVYGVGLPFVWRDQLALDVTSWYATPAGGFWQPSLAGWWAALVSLPLFQFLTVRWFFRFFVWARFLWQVSRMTLDLEPTHPDGTAGLHFLARTGRACNLVLLALGTVLAGLMANKIFYEGAKLLDFKLEVFGTVGLLLLVILGPLLFFTPQLRRARRNGLEDCGTLGQRYARAFSRKWLHADRPAGEPLLGSADIQSLADLHNVYAMMDRIRLTPFGMRNATALALTVLLPVAPLLLTTFSVEQLVDRVLKALL